MPCEPVVREGFRGGQEGSSQVKAWGKGVPSGGSPEVGISVVDAKKGFGTRLESGLGAPLVGLHGA